MSDTPQTTVEPVTVESSMLTKGDFYNQLTDRVSLYNATLLLRVASVPSGLMNFPENEKLNKDQARALCLELIKQGGPAFQVGSALYSQTQ